MILGESGLGIVGLCTREGSVLAGKLFFGRYSCFLR